MRNRLSQEVNVFNQEFYHTAATMARVAVLVLCGVNQLLLSRSLSSMDCFTGPPFFVCLLCDDERPYVMVTMELKFNLPDGRSNAKG